MPFDYQSKPRFEVGIVMHSGQEHMRQVALGVVNYTQINPDWGVKSEGFHPLVPWTRMKSWRGDGLIAIVNSHQQIEMLHQSGAPFVLAGSRIIDPSLSMVASDNAAIGQAAAEHLIDCGFRKLVFFGQTVWADEQLRMQGFRDAVEKADLEFQVVDLPLDEYQARDSSTHYRTNIQLLAKLLGQLEAPFAAFCPNAVIARGLVEAAAIAKLRVPDDVGIVGVNDDPLECESIRPAISTVVQQSQRIGFNAMELLNGLLTSSNMQPEHRLLAPLGVVTRRSTDVMLVEDRKVEAAMRFMRDHIAERIDVNDVVKAIGISRRSLEVKFKRVLNRTPLAELNRIRIGEAKKALQFTEKPITQIALDSGFGSSQSFCVAFKKACGCSPTEFRRSRHTA